MVSFFRRPRLTVPIAATLAVLIGAGAAIAFALIPLAALESLVLASGLPAVVAAAEPPLGLTARAVLVLIGGGVIGLLFWGALHIAYGNRRITIGARRRRRDRGAAEDGVPVLRRADAHPDAPARAPLVASRDLGTPFLEIHARAADPITDDELEAGFSEAAAMTMPAASLAAEAPERALPADLDVPLAAFDPDAFAAAGHRPAPRFAEGERIATFDLRPPVTVAAPAEPVAPRTPRDTEATITALLERLERGVSQRAARAPTGAIGTPRRLATGA